MREVRGAFDNAIERAGIPRVTLHGMRHIYATEIGKHLDMRTKMDLLGHADSRTTMRYVHRDNEYILS
jgi:integrase